MWQPVLTTKTPFAPCLNLIGYLVVAQSWW